MAMPHHVSFSVVTVVSFGLTREFSYNSAERKQVYKIAQIGADGIGPEVIDAGVRVIHAVAKKLGGATYDFTNLDWSSDRYKRTGSYVPKDYLEVLRKHDAIL
jgi:tartrate dehydrogenase/decarboxylase/D-malate dehydrogenase